MTDGDFYFIPVAGKDGGLEKLNKAVDAVNKKINDKPMENSYIYSVEPKELAQNISDVSEYENLKSYTLSLKAAMPQNGIGADAYMDYMKRIQKNIQAVKRQPLVVGFIDGSDTFGWVLGLKFEIGDDGDVEFNQVPTTYSVQASIVVPSWIQQVSLTPTYKSTKKNGKAAHWYNADNEPVPVEETCSPMTVQLPVNYSALTAFLLKDVERGKP